MSANEQMKLTVKVTPSPPPEEHFDKKLPKLFSGEFDALIFDLDGVVTATARTHFRSWKLLFEEYLKSLGSSHVPHFTQQNYTQYVDGRPRYEGVETFLKSRKIELPFGDPSDKPGYNTCCALGNMKNGIFNELVDKEGVQIYESSVQMIKQLKEDYNMKTAVVTSSKNCVRILKAANLESLFDERVDGIIAADTGLRGKPFPDTFVEAAKLLGVDPKRCVVFEDATVGVAAGRAGNFKLVVGVNRGAGEKALLNAGADVVVSDLGEFPQPSQTAQLQIGTSNVNSPPALTPGLVASPKQNQKSILPSPPQVEAQHGVAASWVVKWNDYSDEQQRLSESLATTGNGYFCTRGAFPFVESNSNQHCPGTYIAGVYNRADTKMGDHVLSNEDLVCMPNWLGLTFRHIDEDEWFNIDEISNMKSFNRTLHLRNGILYTDITVVDSKKRETNVKFRQFVHMHYKHICGVEMCIIPKNWSGKIEVRSSINGNVINDGVPRYRKLNQHHLDFVNSSQFNKYDVFPLEEWEKGKKSEDDIDPIPCIQLMSKTKSSGICVSEAARLRVFDSNHNVPLNNVNGQVKIDNSYIAQYVEIDMKELQEKRFEKVCTLFTSKDYAIHEPALASKEFLLQQPNFVDLINTSTDAWTRLWHRFDTVVETLDEHKALNPNSSSPSQVSTGDHKRRLSLTREIMGNDSMKTPMNEKKEQSEQEKVIGAADLSRHDVQLICRLHTFHLLQSLSPNTIDADVGVPARGWHGEAYRGHVFWDEIFILPFITYRLPALTGSLLRYRVNRLERARQNARESGFNGAMFPWQSSSDGREESQKMHLNPQSGRWIPDNSSLQRHSCLAIAWNIWEYYRITNDIRWMSNFGCEVLIEVARFFASAVTWNKKDERYDLHNIMGPDEYHDAYPDKEDDPGLSNNAYTNVMVSWLMGVAIQSIKMLDVIHQQELWQRLKITTDETLQWAHIRRYMKVCFHTDPLTSERVISQFEGYGDLQEFDWDGYRKKYGNIQRLDRILEAEGDSCNKYKLSKQADVLMLLYAFSVDQVKELFDELGYTIDDKLIRTTVRYYLKRTSHGSTLSHLVHSWVLSRYDREDAWKHFIRVLISDVRDVQGGTTAEGIHLGAMVGTVDLIQRSFAGLSIGFDTLYFNPFLPQEIYRLQFRVRFRSHYWIKVQLFQDHIELEIEDSSAPPMKAKIQGVIYHLEPGRNHEFSI